MRYFGAALIGLLVGLLYCYWKQLQTVYENRDVISSGANLVGAVEDFYGALKQKV